ncbi:MAG: hypothetical protein H0T46_21355 [Deltaproteobacteria bacterium]|nr:hypothetical protein [Deltaproteobacteria bacterium]
MRGKHQATRRLTVAGQLIAHPFAMAEVVFGAGYLAARMFALVLRQSTRQ